MAEPGRERLCAVSVDLDPLECYFRIHGLHAPRFLPDPVMTEALPRFLELFAARHVPATFFVVGETARSEVGATLLPRCVAEGHELGNHSYRHPYDLFRRDAAAIRDELRAAHEAIGSVGGRAPRGFRAPGYGLSVRLLEEVAALGYTYDSSVLPSLPYYAAKAAVMGLLRVLGRPSRSALADPRLLLSPAGPYRPAPAAPWQRGQDTLVELPITCTHGLRVPLIGTSLMAAPTVVRRLLTADLVRHDVINLELHGLDLVDAEADQVPHDLVARQHDLRVPFGHRRAALGATFDAIAAAGFTFVTLLHMAQVVQRGEL